ncbi:MAG TPA: zinc ribbon domain-containing protein [Firmicutes bacterium]|nr:zinc ribbon domain-containing protein [Bacillota bacterium]
MSIEFFLLAFMLPGLLFILAFWVMIGIWVYRDSKARGANTLLWTLLVLLVSQGISLLLYFIIGRRATTMVCPRCGQRVNTTDTFCSRCGNDLTVTERPAPVKTKWGLFIAAMISFAMGIICMISGMIVTFALDRESFALDSGYVYGSVQSAWGDTWSISFLGASDGYRQDQTMRMEEGEALYIEVSSESGELLLYISQDDTEECLDLTGMDGGMVYILDRFSPGKIKLCLESNGARNVKAHFEIVPEEEITAKDLTVSTEFSLAS